MEESRSAFKILTDKPTEKRSSGRPRRRWENNVRMDLKEISINTSNWVDSAQYRDYWRALVNLALNLRAPQAMELVSIRIMGNYKSNISQRFTAACTLEICLLYNIKDVFTNFHYLRAHFKNNLLARHPNEGQGQSSDCWRHVHFSTDRDTDHPVSLGLTCGHMPGAPAKFLTMLSWHRSHTPAENSSPSGIKLAPYTIAGVQSTSCIQLDHGTGTTVYFIIIIIIIIIIKYAVSRSMD